MNDPRSSTDPDLIAALKAWDSATPFRDSVFDDAMRIRTALHNTASHRAYGWAAMTCGRIAAYRERLDFAEVLLTEALGRFSFVGDKYGELGAQAHLAIPEISRSNLDHALELVQKALSSGVAFADCDAHLLHSIAAQCYWVRNDPNPALLHLLKAYDLVKNTDDFERASNVIGNIAVILQELGEWDLALAASSEAWRIQMVHSQGIATTRLTHISNMACACREIGDKFGALRYSKLLLEHIATMPAQGSRTIFENLCEAFSINGEIDQAEYCLDRARELSTSTPTPQSTAVTMRAEASLHEAKGEYRAAIGLASQILDQRDGLVLRSNHRFAASMLARCHAALGQTAEAAKWKKVVAESGNESLLGSILSKQLRASLKIKQPNTPLTDQEITCLSLSAHGQTSADIALKLGIKPRTVNFHFNKILRKLNAMNRQEAIVKASEANLLRRS